MSAEEAKIRISEGWQFLAVGSELKMMLDGVRNTVSHLGMESAAKDLAKY